VGVGWVVVGIQGKMVMGQIDKTTWRDGGSLNQEKRVTPQLDIIASKSSIAVERAVSTTIHVCDVQVSISKTENMRVYLSHHLNNDSGQNPPPFTSQHQPFHMQKPRKLQPIITTYNEDR